ncbi:FtsX-like permease family protein, partial [Kitasatospora sp. NPDC004240]
MAGWPAGPTPIPGTPTTSGPAPTATQAPAAAPAPAPAPTATPAPQPVQVAVPQSALTRLGLTAGALPAEVRLDDRYGGAPLTVRITGVYRAADPADPYWRLDPLGGREIQLGGFATYGPLLVDDTVFTAAGLPQNGRNWLLDADFAGLRPDRTDALREEAPGLFEQLRASAGLQARSDLPQLLGELRSGALVARSTLLIGALQLAVLAAAALLLVVHLMAARQEDENALLTARGASRGRLAAFTATEALLLALPAALFAPLLTPPLLRALGSFGPLAHVPLDTGVSADLWPVAAACALVCASLMVRRSSPSPTVQRRAAGSSLRSARVRTGG